MSTLRVLGAVEIARGAGPAPASAGAQPTLRVRRFLAALASRAGEVTSADWLADAVWGDRQPRKPAASVQTLASRLRAVLGDDPAIVLHTRAPGYLLRVADDSFDVRLFERYAAEGARLLRQDPAAAAVALDQALALWTGPAYGEFAGAEFARAQSWRLEDLRASALEDRVEAALALGRHHQVVGEIEALVAAEPLRERRRGQLMLARHRAGRTAEALAAYRAFHDLLHDELGIEPSTALRDLHTQILQGDPRLLRVEPSAPAAAVSGPETARFHAPTRELDPELVGRDHDLAELAELVTSIPVVTLTGPGGVGKTSLARAAAAALQPHFPDGVHTVLLTPVHEPTAVPLAVASALEVPGRAGASPLTRVEEWLAHQRALLVLDNCEHLLDPVAALVDAVRARAPGVHVLMTSQAPVAVSGEQLVEVPPLATDLDAVARSPAVQLFVQRARAHRRDFALSAANERDVAEICRRLDGLPLAIELAAAKMRAMGPGDLLARLSGRFRLLHGGARTAVERHRALRALVDWSYELLSPREQQVFDVLSVFAGRFTLEQAEALASSTFPELGDTVDVAADVLALVDRSMVASRPGSATTYALLETLRDYGQERLRERGAASRAHDRHAEQTADLVSPTRTRLYSVEQVQDVALVHGALDEMRAGFAWSVERDPRVAARIVSGAATLVEMRMAAEPGHWAQTLLARAAKVDLPPEDLAWVHAVAASTARFTGELSRAEEHARRSAALADQPVTRCYATYVLSETQLFRGDIAASADQARQGQAVARESGLLTWEVVFGMSIALVHAYTGDVGTGLQVAEETAALAAGLGGGPASAWCTYVRGEVLLDTDPAAAAPLLERALRQASEIGDRFLYGAALLSLASARSRHGDPALAVPTFRQSVEHWRLTGNWTQQWTTLRNVVVLMASLGRHEAAATMEGAIAASQPAARPVAAEAERLRRTHASLVAHLGEEGYDEAARAGAHLDPPGLVSYALSRLV